MVVAALVAVASSRLMDIVGTSWSIRRDGLTILQGRVDCFAQGRVGLGTRCPTPKINVQEKYTSDQRISE